MRTYLCMRCSWLLLCPVICAAQSYDPVEKYLERAFSVGVVLSDSEVVSFGLHDFDPNELFNLHNDNIGSEDALELRQQLAVTSLPYTFRFDTFDPKLTQLVTTRFSIISSDNSVKVEKHPGRDSQQELILGGMLGYGLDYQYDPHWSFTPTLGVHFQYYHNEHQYLSEYSQQQIKPQLEGVLYNTDAYAVTFEPAISVKYKQELPWGIWRFNSAAHYFYGFGGGAANDGNVGNPEGWYLSNGIELLRPLSNWSGSVQSLYATLRRVDIGGDPSHPIGANYYYETSFGWLMTPPISLSWVENLGLGISINYGSAIKGGSVVLFFNQG